MGKEEELFGGVSLDDISDNITEDDGVDVSEFTTSPEEAAAEEAAETKADKKEEKKTDEEKSTDTDGGVDSTFFENEDNINSEENTSINEDSATKSSSPWLTKVASTLLAEDLIELEEGQEITSAEELVEGWRKKMLSSEFSDLDDNQKIYLKSLRNGIPEEEIKTNLNNQKALDGITPEMISENEDLRKTLIEQNYLAKGLSQEEAAKLAGRSIDVGDDEEDAKKAFDSLSKIEANRLNIRNKEIAESKKIADEKNEKSLSELKDKILNTEEFLPGLKSNSTTKNKIFDNMTKIIDYDKSGNPLNAIDVARAKDPQGFATTLSAIFTLTNGFKDLNKLKNSNKSAAIKELDDSLKSNHVGGGTPKTITSSTGKGLAGAIGNLNI